MRVTGRSLIERPDNLRIRMRLCVCYGPKKRWMCVLPVVYGAIGYAKCVCEIRIGSSEKAEVERLFIEVA